MSATATDRKLVHNFSAGPAVLPREAIEEAAEALLDWNGSGLSVMEVSHRGKDFVAVMEEARSMVKELYGLGDEYSVLFLGGGASTQFFHIPYNLLNENETAAYVNTGTWASKAIKEVGNFGKVNVVASSEDKGFSYIPKGYEIPADAKYLHITTNNTIAGTQYHDYPKADCWKIADMSSDIFCKEIDASQFDLIYAGAQKNLGPAGTTIVIVKESILGKVERNIPTMVDYRTHIAKDSMFNTPPVFPVFVCHLTLNWLKRNGGVKAMQEVNERKANKLYSEIDRNGLFKGVAAEEDRSWMNATFVMNDESMNDEFLAFATANDISGIKGHRSVGGFRASTYNALPEASVDHLISVMQEFERTKG